MFNLKKLAEKTFFFHRFVEFVVFSGVSFENLVFVDFFFVFCFIKRGLVTINLLGEK